MQRQPSDIPCYDCELELAESPIELRHLPRPPQENNDHLEKLRQLWRLASSDERELFLDWISKPHLR